MKNKILIRVTFLLGITLLLGGFVSGIAVHFFNSDFNTETSGQIGDTLSGFLSPVLNLVGAYLVFLSFLEQQSANKIQFDALRKERRDTNGLNRFNQLVNLMDDIEREFKEFKIKVTIMKEPGVSPMNGEAAFNAIIEHYKHKQDESYFSVYNVQNMEDVDKLYDNFSNLILFTATGIINYKYDRNSQQILRLKFLNIVSKFEDIIANIRKATADLNHEPLYVYAISKISDEVFFKIQQVRLITRVSVNPTN